MSSHLREHILQYANSLVHVQSKRKLAGSSNMSSKRQKSKPSSDVHGDVVSELMELNGSENTSNKLVPSNLLVPSQPSIYSADANNPHPGNDTAKPPLANAVRQPALVRPSPVLEPSPEQAHGGRPQTMTPPSPKPAEGSCAGGVPDKKDVADDQNIAGRYSNGLGGTQEPHHTKDDASLKADFVRVDELSHEKTFDEDETLFDDFLHEDEAQLRNARGEGTTTKGDVGKGRATYKTILVREPLPDLAGSMQQHTSDQGFDDKKDLHATPASPPPSSAPSTPCQPLSAPIPAFLRKQYPEPVRPKPDSAAPAISASDRILTCFRIAEVLRHVAASNLSSSGSMLIELYATVTESSRQGEVQNFKFADLFFPHRPPYLIGMYKGWMACEVYDEDSSTLLTAESPGRAGAFREQKICRMIARSSPQRSDKTASSPTKHLHGSPTQRRQMVLEVLSIWKSDWAEVEHVRGIVAPTGLY